MDNYRIVWVHGIGEHPPGYSASWEEAYNAYLHLDHASYVEVCWDTVFGAPSRGAKRGMISEPIALTADELQKEQELRRDLGAVLSARAWTLADAARGRREVRGPERGVLEWSELANTRSIERGIVDWIMHPDEYLGDFTKYLVSPRVRAAVKEEFKKQLRQLAGSEYHVSVIAHSWGTVVAYEGLIDLVSEGVGLQVANLFTLGSPLWLIRRMLEDPSGHKPQDVARWVNVHARGDVIGSWLRPDFQVDKDFGVLSLGPDPHGSYFVPGNEAVQHDLVTQMILHASPSGRRRQAPVSS